MVAIERASLALFSSRILARVVGFVSVVYFARVVGATGLGIYFTFVTVISVAGVFAKFGVPGAVVKRFNQTPDPERRGAYLTGAVLLTAIPFLATTVLLVGLGPWLVEYVGLAAAVPLAVLVLGIDAGGRLAIAALRGENRVASTAWLELLNQVVRVGASVLLLLQGFGVVALVYGHALGGVAQAAAGGILANTGFALPDRDAVASLFGFSKYTAGMNVSALAYNWMDTLVLAAFATKAAVGIYETAWMISAMTLLTARAIGVALAPNVTRWHEANNLGQIEAAFTHAITYAVVLVLPAFVGALVIGDAVFATLYGFDSGRLVLLVLLAGQLAQAVKHVTQNVLFGVDHPEHVFWTNVLTLAANLGLNLALVPQYGMLGAAVATGLTAGVAAVSQFWVLRRYLDLGVPYGTIAWQLAAAIAMGAVVWLLATVVSPSTLPGLGILLVAGGLLYGLGVLSNASMRGRLLDTTPW